jgi:uncharacterized membrane protein
MGERAMRPFWIHQAAEYLIGIALVASALQDPEPVVPALVGTLVILNAAVVRGPLGAFKWFGRRMHKWIDLGLMIVIALVALQPWADVATTGRVMMLVILLPFGFLWFYTDWAERPARKDRRVATAGPTGEKIGRSAGRIAGSGYVAAKQAIKKRSG